jgi:hypothetical protein
MNLIREIYCGTNPSPEERWGVSETSEMKAHPGALIHVIPESFALNDPQAEYPGKSRLDIGSEPPVEVRPRLNRASWIACPSWEPLIRLLHEADVCLVALASMKGNHFEVRFSALNLKR